MFFPDLDMIIGENSDWRFKDGKTYMQIPSRNVGSETYFVAMNASPSLESFETNVHAYKANKSFKILSEGFDGPGYKIEYSFEVVTVTWDSTDGL